MAVWLLLVAPCALAWDEAHIAFFNQIGTHIVRHLLRLVSHIHHRHNLYGVQIDSKLSSHVRRQTQRQLFALNLQYRHNVLLMQLECVP